MLSHVSQASAVVIPIAAECAVNTMVVIGFVGSWTEPHVVVQLFWDGLRCKVRAPLCQIQLPIKPCTRPDKRR